MTPKFLALLVGGLVPAIFLGLAAIMQKLISQYPIGIGPFLIVTGLGTCLAGAVFLAIDRDPSLSPASIGMTFIFGLFWATATGCISIALKKLGGSISQLAPLYNTNTLVAVVISLVLLSEWKTVQPTRILIASAFIIIGGVLAARS